MADLFRDKLQVLNVGLASFAESITRAGGTVTHIDWAPPARGDRKVCADLARLVDAPAIEAANRQAFAAFQAAAPVLEGIGIARETLPGMGDRMILHAGPPVDWQDMCGPMQGAITGAILYEGWAVDPRKARALAASGEITFEPCHHHGAVGPMAGVISPSMPVWIVFNPVQGNRAYSNFNEGLGKALRFGAYGPEVIDRLRWMAETLTPTLRAALGSLGPVEIKPLIAQALHMGDEVHNRNAAASALLLKRLIPALLRPPAVATDPAAAVDFIASNDHFFLNISMATCKAMLDAAHNVPGSSMVTAMARNGVKFGIRVSGTAERWFTAPAPSVEGLYFAGYTRTDAAPDLGDSAITETAGLGGFAMAAAPAIIKFVGGSSDDALSNTLEMITITLGANGSFTLPALDFCGTPSGIDIRKVVDTGIEPIINTGIAHRESGIGQIGAGVTRAPLACFAQAVSALASSLETS
jgi:hypothetical protein